MISRHGTVRTSCAALIVGAVIIQLSANAKSESDLQSPTAFLSIGDRADRSQMIFAEIAKVLTSPRCMNCHPAGDQPVQRDDQHIHRPLARRGANDDGVAGMPCAYRSIPGHPRWALAPLEMAWEGKSIG